MLIVSSDTFPGVRQTDLSHERGQLLNQVALNGNKKNSYLVDTGCLPFHFGNVWIEL